MVGSNGTMIAVRLVRSKLRKREDQINVNNNNNNNINSINNNNSNNNNNNLIHQLPITLSTFDGGYVNPVGPDIETTTTCEQSSTIVAVGNGCIVTETTTIDTCQETTEQFIWQFPPPYPPPQYSLYNDQDTLVHGMVNNNNNNNQVDRQNSFAKGIRKNIGGRWRRLVKKKQDIETCSIPPELKDQLKTIYVY